MLMMDESFFDFLVPEDQKRTMDCTKTAGEDPSVFVLKSFTKMYASAGASLWLCYLRRCKAA